MAVAEGAFLAIDQMLNDFEPAFKKFIHKIAFERVRTGSQQVDALERWSWACMTVPYASVSVCANRDKHLETEQRDLWRQFLELEQKIQANILCFQGTSASVGRRECIRALEELHRLVREGEFDVIGESAAGDAVALLSRLRSALTDLEKEAALVRIEERVNEATPKKEPPAEALEVEPDGPEDPNQLRWRGKVYDFQPLLWRSLRHMWDKDSSSELEFTEAVWEGKFASESMLRSCLYRFNKFLLRSRIGLGWHLSQKGGAIRKIRHG